eukprot:SAG31_NODE_4235_length_3432_cov_1.728773_3_plen_86_part_00
MWVRGPDIHHIRCATRRLLTWNRYITPDARAPHWPRQALLLLPVWSCLLQCAELAEMDESLLMKALSNLEQRGKAAVFEDDVRCR